MGEEEGDELNKAPTYSEKENCKNIVSSRKLDTGQDVSSGSEGKVSVASSGEDGAHASKKKNVQASKKEGSEATKKNSTASTNGENKASVTLLKKEPGKTSKGKTKNTDLYKNDCRDGETAVDAVRENDFDEGTFTKEMADINEMVLEFLQWCGLPKVGKLLQETCAERGVPVPTLAHQAASRRATPFRLESADGCPGVTLEQAVPLVLQLFDQCDGERFFQLFQQVWHSQQGADEDLSLLTLQFHLHVYFATAPIRLGRKEDHVAAMTVFKQYVDTCPSQLGSVSELLPFYALPYVPEPHTHAAFSSVFQESWQSCLRSRLHGWLKECLIPPPALVAMVVVVFGRWWWCLAGGGGVWKMVVVFGRWWCLAGGGVWQVVVFIVVMLCIGVRSSKSSAGVACGVSGAVAEASRSHRALKRKLRRLQDDYHRLLGVSLELTSALQQSVTGADVDLEATLAACTHRHPDLFTSALADTQASPATILMETLHRSGLQGVSSAPLSALDYTAVSTCLSDGGLLDCLLLLQALRQRVTRVTEGGARQAVVASYVRSDVLGIAQPSHDTTGDQHPVSRCWARLSLGLRSPEPHLLGNSLARLLSALASFPLGRHYLGRSLSVCSLLQGVLLEDLVDAATQDLCLAALQKLSVRGNVQERLIKGGCVEWTVRALDEGAGTLSPSSQECCAALLLNLSLRSEGRAAILPLMSKLIPTITKLLAEKRPTVVSYMSGVLYSLLSEPRFRHEALALRLDSFVARLAQSSEEEEYRQQLQYLVSQLLREDSPTPPVSPPPSPPHLQDVPEFLEDELELDDPVQAAPGQAYGERLLARRYAVNNSTEEFLAMENPGMSRSAPTFSTVDLPTPGTPKAGRPYSDGGPPNAVHLPQLQRGIQSAFPAQRWSMSAGSVGWRYPSKEDALPNTRTAQRSDAWNSAENSSNNQHPIPQHMYSNGGSLQPVYCSSQQYPRYTSISHVPIKHIQVYQPPQHPGSSYGTASVSRYSQRTPPNTAECSTPIAEEEEETEAEISGPRYSEHGRQNSNSEATSRSYTSPDSESGRLRNGLPRTNSVQQSARKLQNRNQVQPLMLLQTADWQADQGNEDAQEDQRQYQRYYTQERATSNERNTEYVRRDKQLLSHDYVEYDQKRPEEYNRSYQGTRDDLVEYEQRRDLEVDDPYEQLRYNIEPEDQYGVEQRRQHQKEYFNRQEEMEHDETQQHSYQRTTDASNTRNYDSRGNEEINVQGPDGEQSYMAEEDVQPSYSTTSSNLSHDYDYRAEFEERSSSPPVATGTVQTQRDEKEERANDSSEDGRLRTAVHHIMQNRVPSIEKDPLLKSLPTTTAKEYVAIFSSKPRVMRTPPDSASGQRLSPNSWYANQPDSARRVLPPISKTNKIHARERI
ncbi:Armadillo-type fold [Trinorchestia longiramus]|nr:Armadillo-type fold [Trinorchestia longiramus]